MTGAEHGRTVAPGPCARSSTDRASDYGSEGWGFESLRARLQKGPVTCEDILIPGRSVRSIACRMARISYRSRRLVPAQWLAASQIGRIADPGRLIWSILCVSVRVAARSWRPRRLNHLFHDQKIEFVRTNRSGADVAGGLGVLGGLARSGSKCRFATRLPKGLCQLRDPLFRGVNLGSSTGPRSKGLSLTVRVRSAWGVGAMSRLSQPARLAILSSAGRCDGRLAVGYSMRLSAGSWYVPSVAGCCGWYMRRIGRNGPSGVGSQFAAASGDVGR